MEQYKLSGKNPCPNCQTELDGVSGKAVPKEDDYSVCKYCGTFLRFNKDLSYRVIEDREVWDAEDLSSDNKVTLFMLQHLYRK